MPAIREFEERRNIVEARGIFCAGIGALGSAIAAALGGWDAPLLTLIICMAADYATGLLVAGIFHASKKSTGGGLESAAGWKGLSRKAATLLLILVAHFTDTLLGTDCVRNAVVIGFCTNEILSIVENAGLMGLPIPAALAKAIDVLKNQSEAQ